MADKLGAMMEKVEASRQFRRAETMPCPKCRGTDLDVFSNCVECLDCGYTGPMQKGPELYCDWRQATYDWNTDPVRKETDNG